MTNSNRKSPSERNLFFKSSHENSSARSDGQMQQQHQQKVKKNSPSNFSVQYTHQPLTNNAGRTNGNRRPPPRPDHSSSSFRPDLDEGFQRMDVAQYHEIARQKRLLEDEKSCKFIVETHTDFIIHPVAELKWRLKSACVEAYFYHRRNLHLYRHQMKRISVNAVTHNKTRFLPPPALTKSPSHIRTELKEQTSLLLHDVDAMFKICANMMREDDGESITSSPRQSSDSNGSSSNEEEEQDEQAPGEGAVLAFRHIIDQLGTVRLWKRLV